MKYRVLRKYRTSRTYRGIIGEIQANITVCTNSSLAHSPNSSVNYDNSLTVYISSFNSPENLDISLCYDVKTQQLILEKSQALPVRRDVIISAKAAEIFSWEARESAAITPAEISDAMDAAIMPFKFKNYNGAMLYADSELKKIIEGVVPLNNALNKLQKEINARLQY